MATLRESKLGRRLVLALMVAGSSPAAARQVAEPSQSHPVAGSRAQASAPTCRDDDCVRLGTGRDRAISLMSMIAAHPQPVEVALELEVGLTRAEFRAAARASKARTADRYFGLVGKLRSDLFSLVRSGTDSDQAGKQTQAVRDDLAAIDRVRMPTVDPAIPKQFERSRPADVTSLASAIDQTLNPDTLQLMNVCGYLPNSAIATSLAVEMVTDAHVPRSKWRMALNVARPFVTALAEENRFAALTRVYQGGTAATEPVADSSHDGFARVVMYALGKQAVRDAVDPRPRKPPASSRPKTYVSPDLASIVQRSVVASNGGPDPI